MNKLIATLALLSTTTLYANEVTTNATIYNQDCNSHSRQCWVYSGHDYYVSNDSGSPKNYHITYTMSRKDTQIAVRQFDVLLDSGNHLTGHDTLSAAITCPFPMYEKLYADSYILENNGTQTKIHRDADLRCY